MDEFARLLEIPGALREGVEDLGPDETDLREASEPVLRALYGADTPDAPYYDEVAFAIWSAAVVAGTRVATGPGLGVDRRLQVSLQRAGVELAAVLDEWRGESLAPLMGALGWDGERVMAGLSDLLSSPEADYLMPEPLLDDPDARAAWVPELAEWVCHGWLIGAQAVAGGPRGADA